MANLTTRKTAALAGATTVPGDKSISHRALLLGMLSRGACTVKGWLPAGDTLSTLGAVRALGIDVHREGTTLAFTSAPLRAPAGPVDCGNAGTLIRLISGILAGQSFPTVLEGSEQLRRRPMKRIVEPLARMGAAIEATNGCAPLNIRPAALRGITHTLPIASAQVKSAILLAGLFAEGETVIEEPGPSRDHTERMLRSMGAPLAVDGLTVRVTGGDHHLQPFDLTVPGDPSSAAFLIVAAACLPGSDVMLHNICINPTRTGVIDIMRRMGAEITIEDEIEQSGEPVATLRVHGGALRGVTISGDDVVRAIDELPILAIAATQAEGETVIRDAQELRVKEVDRISVVAGEMRKLGAQVEEQPDGMIIQGGVPLRGASVKSHGDHRLVMALAVAGLFASGETTVDEAECAADSFPGFAETLARIGAEVA
ncbi:MAG: 3-phosphoshikimate 1-carboxyvinyltransferase [Anaerolineae bacterium]|nr:3-phosphoshikimate 1-carboxyvinyltransferase [Anaerolineae bacterium]